MCQWFDSTFRHNYILKTLFLSMNKTLLNFLTKFKSTSLANKKSFVVTYNKILERICALLYKEGLLQHFNIFLDSDNIKKLSIEIRFVYDKPLFHRFNNISKPSNIKYLSVSELARISTKTNILIVSTPIGLLTSESCIKQKKGGTPFFCC